MESKTARLTVLIEPRTKEQFERVCAHEDMTPSQVVRRLIRQWMEQNNQVAEGTVPRKKAGRRAG